MNKTRIEDVQNGDTLYIVTPSRKINVKVKKGKVYDIQDSVSYLYVYLHMENHNNIVLTFDKLKILDDFENGVQTYYNCEGYYQRAFIDENLAIQYAIGLIDCKIIELKKNIQRLKNGQRV